MQRFLKA